MTDEYSTAERLAFEHSKAIHELNLKREKWAQLKQEYTGLKETVTSLPTKLTHDVMIPIGSVGMFQGKLVHTNEIMVLLGENWFAQCTTNQATGIIERRIKMVESNLEEIIREIGFLESRKKVAEDLSTMDKEQDIVEIKEESKEEASKPAEKRRIAHNASHSVIQRSVKDLGKATASQSKPENAASKKDDAVEKLFARLSELELEETANELQENSMKIESLNLGHETRVHFEEDSVEGTSNNHKSVHSNRGKENNCIRFRHTSDEERNSVGSVPESKNQENSPVEGNGVPQKFVSPADIYNHFAKPLVADMEEKPLKSILKKERKYSSEGVKPKPILKHSPEHKSDGSSGDELVTSAAVEDPKPILKGGSDAFSDTVVERNVSVVSEKSEIAPAPKKQLSRFKASRMRK